MDKKIDSYVEVFRGKEKIGIFPCELGKMIVKDLRTDESRKDIYWRPIKFSEAGVYGDIPQLYSFSGQNIIPHKCFCPLIFFKKGA